jgi:hypothetical protein
MQRYGVAILLVILTGCNTVGPKTIEGARFNYNEAIVQSRDQQLLLNLVRLKYRDTPLFLEVTSVSTQYTFSADAGVGGISLDDGGITDGALDAGVGYTEKPTVQYTPLQGKQFVSQLLTPIPLEALLLLEQSGWSLQRILMMCAQDLNGVYNAPSASGPTPEYAPEFEDFLKVVEILRRLQVARAVELGIQTVNAEGTPPVSHVFIRLDSTRGAAADHSAIKDMLGLPQSATKFRLGSSRVRASDIQIRTRSLVGVMNYLSQAVEAPDHDDDRVTTTRLGPKDDTEFEWTHVLGELIQIHSAASRPTDAHTAVNYRGTWFYIEDTNLKAKSTFGLLSTLFSLQAGEVESLAPALTLSIGN